MKRIYLGQVICKEDSCYQYVTKSFTKQHPDLNFIELFELTEEEIRKVKEVRK